MKRLLLISFAALFLFSCKGSVEVDPEFLSSDPWCLNLKGKTVLKYEEALWQYSSDGNGKVFRLTDDEGKRFFILSCQETPAAKGEKITADLLWNAGGGIQRKTGVTFTVSSVDGDSFWLWSSKEKLGISASRLR